MSLDELCRNYERSEITTVILEDRQTHLVSNIFSIAEMCPIEQLESPKIFTGDKFPFKSMNLNKNKRIYIARVFSDAPKDSLDFFRGIGQKRVLNIDGNTDTEIYSVDTLVCEPQNEIPLLVYEDSDKEYDIKKVIPYRRLPVYVNTLMDVNNKTRNMLTDKEFLKTTEFIQEVLGIDLNSYSEYFGAILLCMPNSILRDIEINKFKPKNQIKSEMQILISFFEREGKSIVGGNVELIDQRLNGNVYLGKQKIDSSRMVVNIPYDPDKLRIKVFDENDNLIYELSGSFIKGFNLSLGIKGPDRNFNIINGDGQTSKRIDTITYENIKIGEYNKNELNSRIMEQKRDRELSILESKREFIYFEGHNNESKRKAQQIVRELISKTREECIICDPYLSAKDVLDFAIEVRAMGVEIKLLSSKKFLDEKENKEEKITNGEKLYDMINQLNEKNKYNKFNCRVLKGRKKSPLHDRFIIIDKNAYILGSSLNEFGSRETTLFKVPNAKPLIKQANFWFSKDDESISIEEWMKNKENTMDK